MMYILRKEDLAMTNSTRAITYADVARYQHLRETDRKLMARIMEMKTIPPGAFDEIGTALGIMVKGVLVFDTMDVSSVLADCCLHDWIRDGQNLIAKFHREHPAPPGTDEDYLLRAHQQARFRVLISERIARGAGLECVDALCGERLFLMDIALADHAPTDVPLALATRTIPLDGYWSTTGAALPIINQKNCDALLQTYERLTRSTRPVDPHKLALTIIRTCLDGGAAEHVRYEGVDEDEEDFGELQMSEAPPHPSRIKVGRNDPCPCGSGRKYKRCCLLK
jgi:hypothetical protein